MTYNNGTTDYTEIYTEVRNNDSPGNNADDDEFGKIVGFVHPDEIFSESYEKGFNGKDLLQCVEISSKSGLPRKIGTNKSPKIFLADHQRCKICQILPMGKDGGLRIKNYTEPE